MSSHGHGDDLAHAGVAHEVGPHAGDDLGPGVDDQGRDAVGDQEPPLAHHAGPGHPADDGGRAGRARVAARHRRHDHGEVEARRPAEDVGVGRRPHPAVEVELAVDRHRREVAGDRARGRHRRGQRGRHVPAQHDPAEVAPPDRADPQVGGRPRLPEDRVEGARPLGHVEGAVGDHAGHRHHRVEPPRPADPRRHQVRARQPGRPADQRPQADRREVPALAQRRHHLRRRGGGRVAGRDRGQVCGGDPPAQQRGDQRPGRCPDDDLGRPRVPTQLALERRQRGGVVGEAHDPAGPEDQPDARRAQADVTS